MVCTKVPSLFVSCARGLWIPVILFRRAAYLRERVRGRHPVTASALGTYVCVCGTAFGLKMTPPSDAIFTVAILSWPRVRHLDVVLAPGSYGSEALGTAGRSRGASGCLIHERLTSQRAPSLIASGYAGEVYQHCLSCVVVLPCQQVSQAACSRAAGVPSSFSSDRSVIQSLVRLPSLLSPLPKRERTDP